MVGKKFLHALMLVSCSFVLPAAAQQSYLSGFRPGAPTASIENETIAIGNDVLSARWSFSQNKLRGNSLSFTEPHSVIAFPKDAFVLVFADGRQLHSSAMQTTDGPRIEELPTDPAASRLEEHFPGKRVVAILRDPNTGLRAEWSAILRDGDNYLRQEISFIAATDEAVREVLLLDLSLPAARLAGTVAGSPVTAGNIFLGFEHPISRCTANAGHVQCAMHRELPMKAGQRVTYSSVIGISPAGQMRRGVLNYSERQRAHPYRPFLHYNSWFDIGYGNPYDQAAALDRIHAFGEQLSVKRHVKMDSFLFDDGWDDPQSLWSFNSGFPDGFAPLRTAAAEYSAAPGVWLSPWGGYDQAKKERLKFGALHGFETNSGGFALSAPKYFARFREVTLDMIRKYGINQFKIDGTGNVNSVFPHSEFDSDFYAAISLIGEWRQLRPDIFVNLTTGTYPSPFWLQYADSIWRGGEDDGFAGVGPWRERWITYRDAHIYAGIVLKGHLFPLNSLMLHGIIYARQAEHLDNDPQHGFVHEVRSYFATGTQLQEMYITPSLLSNENWDDLAEAANWARANSDVLVDTHWVGGDPAKLQVYGWAAWTPTKGILTLRNPSDHPQGIVLTLAKAFDLPAGAPAQFSAHSPWTSDKNTKALELNSAKPHKFMLQPFEVLTLEAVPTR
jgi:hypothetical protein